MGEDKLAEPVESSLSLLLNSLASWQGCLLCIIRQCWTPLPPPPPPHTHTHTPSSVGYSASFALLHSRIVLVFCLIWITSERKWFLFIPTPYMEATTFTLCSAYSVTVSNSSVDSCCCVSQIYKDIYWPVTLKYTQEFVLVTFHSWSALTNRQNIAVSHV